MKRAAAAHAAESQAVAGLFGQDDSENFERIRQAQDMPLAKRLPYHYGMAVGHDGKWPGVETWHTKGLPGVVGPRFTEQPQRLFYAYWAERMGLEGR